MALNIRIPSRIETIQAHQSSGGLIAALFPIHYPRALLRAHNILPVEIWGPPQADSTLADKHLPSYTCSVIRHGLAYLLAGRLDIADLFIVPHCCDTLQGLGSLLLDFLPKTKPVLPFYLPRGRQAMDIDFFSEELQVLNKRLAEISGINPDHKSLTAAIETEDEAVRMVKALFKKRPGLPCPDREFYRLIRSREYLPAEQFMAIAQQVLAEEETVPETDNIPIVLSGIVPEPMDLFDLLTEKGAMVVADDMLTTGRRIYGTSNHQNPLTRIAEAVLQGPPDSTLGSSFEKRREYLIDLVNAEKARGVIFYYVKFCEPEQFYLPALKKGLEEARIPSIVIETELGEPLSNQIVTRLEAFMEMLT